MSNSSARMLVLVGDRFACIKIVGRANLNSSIDFKTVVNELRRKTCHYFVLDLSECVLMDSTFLGILAGFGLKMNGAQKAPDDSAIELLNPNARILELLENLGVLHLFKLTQGPLSQPSQGEARPCPTSNPTPEEVAHACLEAHQTLMAINPDNVSRFKDVAQFLAEDLKRIKGEQG